MTENSKRRGMDVATLRELTRWDDLGDHHSALRLGDVWIASVGRVRSHRKLYPRCYRIDVLGNGYVADAQPTFHEAKRAAERGAAKLLGEIIAALRTR